METYVFGAGASEPYGAPTMGDFLSRAFSGWALTPPDRTSFEQDLKMVAQAIDDYYGTNLLAAREGGVHFSAETAVALDKINVEELLALAHEDQKIDLQRALERMIFNTIELGVRDGSNQNYYQLLVTQLVRSSKRVCLVSFNYDFLLDRALMDGTRLGANTWSYGVSFHAGTDDFPSYRDVTDPAVFLLKLHGSLNWRQCRTCCSLRLHAYNTYDNIFRQTWPPCRACSGSSTRFEPVLVAPTPMKHFPSSLERAWKTAANCLEKTERLTVIGYSFPGLDRKSRMLFLRHFIIPNLFAHSRPKLAIVDPVQSTRETIKSWFLPAVDKNVEEYCSFKEYCAML